MASLISPEIKKQYFDSNGNPLSGGKLYVYNAGTTDLVSSYTSEVGDTANANPIVLDSRGEVGAMFLNVGSYKFVLKDSLDATIWTQDNVTIRDVGAELDVLEATVQTINTTVTEGAPNNRVSSGKVSANSSKSKYLVPIGTSNQVKILATDTDFKYYVAGVEYTIEADQTATGLVSPPTTNNTLLVNDSSLADGPSTRNLGEYGTVIPYDTEGSEITSRDGTLQAFKIVGVSTEYFIGRIDDTAKELTHCERGCFFDSSNNVIERTAFSDNDVITLMKLSYLYLKSDETVIVSYTEPFVGSTEPSAPADGDMWFDVANDKWKRFSSTVFVDADCVAIGSCIQDENGNTVGAMPVEYYIDTSSDNSFQLEYLSATQVRSKARNNFISVNGTGLKFSEAAKVFDIASHLESGETEAASTVYYIYVKENGDSLISPHGPIDKRGDLKGFYHPAENWRYVGHIENNGSSNFDSGTLASHNNDLLNDAISSATVNPTVLDTGETARALSTTGNEATQTHTFTGSIVVTANGTNPILIGCNALLSAVYIKSGGAEADTRPNCYINVKRGGTVIGRLGNCTFQGRTKADGASAISVSSGTIVDFDITDGTSYTYTFELYGYYGQTTANTAASDNIKFFAKQL